MVRFRFEFNPREVDSYLRLAPLRQELVYRLACRSLYRTFSRRTDELPAKFQKELPALLQEAAALDHELVEAVETR